LASPRASRMDVMAAARVSVSAGPRSACNAPDPALGRAEKASGMLGSFFARRENRQTVERDRHQDVEHAAAIGGERIKEELGCPYPVTALQAAFGKADANLGRPPAVAPALVRGETLLKEWLGLVDLTGLEQDDCEVGKRVGHPSCVAKGAEYLQTLSEELPSTTVITAIGDVAGELVENLASALIVSDLSVDPEAPLVEPFSVRLTALSTCNVPGAMEHECKGRLGLVSGNRNDRIEEAFRLLVPTVAP
jgi:hypothetical protein